MKKVKSKKKWIAIIAIVLVAGLVVGLYFKSKTGATAAEDYDIGVEAIPLAKQDLSDSINVTGKVESQNVWVATTEVEAKVKELNVSLGDRVEVGDVLCTFDETELREQIKEMETQIAEGKAQEDAERQAAINEAQTALNSAQSAQASLVAEAQAEVDAAQKAYDDGKKDDELSKKDLADLKDALTAAKKNLTEVTNDAAAQVASAQTSLDNANAATTSSSSSSVSDLNKLKRQLNELTVVAEQAGVVTQLNVSKGSIPNGSLMTIEDDSALKVNVGISEKDILKLQEGMEASITSNALPDEEIKGKVTQVINFATSDSAVTSEEGSTSSGASYSANIDIEPGSKLLLGMSVKVNIMISNEGESLAVPYDSIAEDEDGNSFVYRGTDNGDGTYTIEKVTVKEGNKNDYYTAIDGDVAEGDIIVLYPEMVTEGDSVALSVVDGTTDLSYESEGETEEW